MLSVVSPVRSRNIGFHVSGGQLLERNGTPFIMRGTNYPQAWMGAYTAPIADIAAAGANCVRILLAGGNTQTPTNTVSQVAALIAACKANHLIAILTVYDTTGYNASFNLDAAVTFWGTLKSALVGQENYVIINIGNEPFGEQTSGPYTQANWPSVTSAAVVAMRAAGFTHCLMVDGPNYAQDWEWRMIDTTTGFPVVQTADPLHNTLFSTHMYGVYSSDTPINDYLSAALNRNIPLVIGEFSNKNQAGANVDEDNIMARCVSKGFGYLGWVWTGSDGSHTYFDQVPSVGSTTLSTWGTRLFTGTNGIVATAADATIFG